MKELLKNNRSKFDDFCKRYDLDISYQSNKAAFGILKSVFEQREYSDYFPFYEKVNILDIGAHFGFFSIFASKNIHQDSRIYAIEPSRKNYSALLQNTKDCKVANLTSFNLALGSTIGTTQLFLSASENNTILDKQLLNKSTQQTEEIQVLTLEEFFKENNIDFIHFCKIDCEGAEYQIIESTPMSILDKIETLSIEFHDYKHSEYTVYDLVGKLRDGGFEIVKFSFSPTSMNLNYGKIVATKRFIS